MAEIRRYSFEEGNLARDIETVLPNREEIRRYREHEEKIRRKRNARRKARAVAINKRYTALLSFAVVLSSLFFVTYVHIQNDISTSMKNIASLETQISDLKTSNRAEEARIDTDTNLYVVKLLAITKLGMVYASGDQIVYYDMDNNDYMSQYADIP